MDCEKEILYESLSIIIHDHIRELQYDASLQSSRRWVWELLQNAVDLAQDEQGVQVQYQVEQNSVTFFHNGHIFDIDSLNHLFFKKSQKRQKKVNELTIGNFGTGFLTTHLLSKKIYISGIYRTQKNKYIEMRHLLLDREGNEHNIKKNLMQFSNDRDSLEKSQNVVNYNPHLLTNTQFKYIYKEENEESKQTVLLGIQDLENCLIYSFIFISQLKNIKSVTLIKDKKINVYEFNPQEIQINDISIKQVHISDYQMHIQQLTIKNQYVTLVMPSICKVQGEKYEISLLQRNKDTPNLFLVFPLIGTEHLYYPFILNSFYFHPCKERNGIVLFGPDKERVQANQFLMLQILELSRKFIDTVINTMRNKQINWKNLHLLADIGLPDNKKEYIDLNWYRETIVKPYRKYIFEQPIVLIENDYLPISKIIIPFHQDQQKSLQLAEFCRHIFRRNIPSKEVIKEWTQILTNQPSLWPENSIILDLGQIALYISKLGFEALKQLYIDENQFYEQFNQFLGFMIEFDIKLFEKLEIVPNQLGKFKLASQLFYDDQIPNIYKDCLKIFSRQLDWRADLLDQNIKCPLITQKKNFDDLLTHLEYIIRSPENFQKYSIKEGVMDLLRIVSNKLNKQTQDDMIMLRELLQKYETKIDDIIFETDILPNPRLQYLNAQLINWICENTIREIQTYQNLFTLQKKEFSSFSSNDETEQWLFDFINFSSFKLQTIKNYTVVPNIQGNFINFDDILISKNINLQYLEIYKDIQQFYEKYCSSYQDKQFKFRLLVTRLVNDKLKFQYKHLSNEDIINETESILNAIFNEIIKFNDQYYTYHYKEKEQYELIYKSQFIFHIRILKNGIGVEQILKNIHQSKQVYFQQVQNNFSIITNLFFKSLKTENIIIQTNNLQIIEIIDRLLLALIFYLIRGYNKVASLAAALNLNENQTFECLNKLYECLNLYNLNKELNFLFQWKIFPNQQNFFKSFEHLQLLNNNCEIQQQVCVELINLYDYFQNISTPGKITMMDQILNFSIENTLNFKTIQISSIISELDQLFFIYKNQLTPQYVFEIFTILDYIINEHEGNQKYLSKFFENSASIYIQFFSDVSQRQKVLKLVREGNLDQTIEINQIINSFSLNNNQIFQSLIQKQLQQDFSKYGITVSLSESQITTNEIICLTNKKQSKCYLFIQLSENDPIQVQSFIFNELLNKDIHSLRINLKKIGQIESASIFYLNIFKDCQKKQFKGNTIFNITEQAKPIDWNTFIEHIQL